MSLAALTIKTPQQVFDDLMALRSGHPVEEFLAQIIASWLCGQGAMPKWLGLGEVRFHQMLETHFPSFETGGIPVDTAQPDELRSDEIDDLHKLLEKYTTSGSDSEILMASIVTAGCMGNDHLWQDLGLWGRAELSRLMQVNFQSLAALNNKDMKWKRFLYKQLCETEGIYTCRSPSCEVCTDYQVCFGPED